MSINISNHFKSQLKEVAKNAQLKPVIDKLLYDDIKPPTNWLDVKMVDKNPEVTGIPANVKAVTTSNYKKHPARTVIRFASFIKKLTHCSEDQARAIIEALSGVMTAHSVQLVSGEEIRTCYDRRKATSGGNLWSCMTTPEALRYLDFYVYNPEFIQLAVIRENDLVKARALFIKGFTSEEDALSKKKSIDILGRIYSCEAKYTSALNNWRASNSFHYMSGSHLYGPSEKDKVFVPVKEWELNYYPYQDHLLCIDPKTGLWNNDGKGKTIGTLSGLGGNHRDTPLLDKRRPNMVYVSNNWKERVEGTVWVKGRGWVTPPKPKPPITCAHCKQKVQPESTVAMDSRFTQRARMCKTHIEEYKPVRYNYTHYCKYTKYVKKGEKVLICRVCRNPTDNLRNKKCVNCQSREKCSNCEAVGQTIYFRRIDGKFLCTWHRLPFGTEFCGICKEYKTKPCNHEKQFTTVRVNI